MTNRQENKVGMYQGVTTTLDEHADAPGIVPAIPAANGDLKVKIGEILKKDREKGTVTSGKTVAKNQAGNKLIEQTMKVAGPLSAWGYTNANPAVTGVADIKRSFLTRLRDTELAQKATEIYDAAQAYPEQLTDYGITVEVLNELQARIETYKTAMSEQDSSMASRVSAGVSLATLFQEADIILKLRIDPLMEAVRVVNPDFYNAYKAARVIKDLRGSGKRQVAAAAEGLY